MQSPPEHRLTAHSLAEAHLYLMVSECRHCHKGPLRAVDTQTPLTANRPQQVVIRASCANCHEDGLVTFHLVTPIGLTPGPKTEPSSPLPINPSREPSRILDVGQWLVLYRLKVEEARRSRDKTTARCLNLEAAQCLEEALKFYDVKENDLPPVESLWTETSRRRFRDAPQQFARRRLIELRAKLPIHAAERDPENHSNSGVDRNPKGVDPA